LPSDTVILAKDVSEEAIENWVDSIRLGEGAKEKLPEGLIPEEPEEPVLEEQEPLKEEPDVEEVKVEETKVEEPTAFSEPHDEL